jgi:formamidopyrimidine-DNA glycosylase
MRHVAVGDPKVASGISRNAFAAKLSVQFLGAPSLSRHGKHPLIKLAPGDWTAGSLGILVTGALEHWDSAEPKPPYTRIRFDFADGHHLAYISLRPLAPGGLFEDADRYSAAERLGPDALDPQFDFGVFENALSARKRTSNWS